MHTRDSVSDPGSYAFLVFLTPGSGIRDGKKSGSGMNIPDHFSESLETVFRVENTRNLWCGSGSGIWNIFDTGSGMEKFGSVTLLEKLFCEGVGGRWSDSLNIVSLPTKVPLELDSGKLFTSNVEVRKNAFD